MNRIALSIEDEDSTFFLLKIAFQRADVGACQLVRASDCEEALEFLRRHGQFKNAPRPDVILLDLNLPGMSGGDLLAVLKRDECLQNIPVLVFASPVTDHDPDESLAMGAKQHISKSYDFQSFVHAVKTACAYASQ